MATFTKDPDSPNLVHVKFNPKEIENSANSPIDNIRVNRYMSLSKFEKMLKNNSIWFSRLDKFSDQHEGRAIINWKIDKNPDWWRKYVIASCWNWDVDENFALWNIYLKQSPNSLLDFIANVFYSLKDLVLYLMNKKTLGNEVNGVCIVSSRDDFINSIEDIEYKGRVQDYFVQYVKHGVYHNLINPLTCALRKIEWYRYENEFRFLVYFGGDFPKNGASIKLNCSKMIKGIILSPNISKKARKKVNFLATKYGISTFLITDSVVLDRLN